MFDSSYKVKTCFGEVKNVTKLAFFCQTDQSNEIIYCIEGQDFASQFLISYHYDEREAIKDYNHLLNNLLQVQVDNLKKRCERI